MAAENPGSIRPLARGTLKLQSDERLLKLFRRGVEPAFEELINRYRVTLVAYAGSIAGPDRGEDVVQDALVKAHRSLRDDRDIDPRPWLYAVVRNTALNDVRDNRKHRHDGLGETATGGTSPDELVEQRERFAAVLAAVADLPPAQRRALVDHELSGFSHEEIAAELDLSTGATKQLIYRARLSLRNAFGAMIPIPLIAWLAEGSGVVATGAAGTGATATGLMGAIGGGSAAKLAVVAVVAGGSLAGGIAVERHQADRGTHPDTAQAAEPGDSGAAAPNGEDSGGDDGPGNGSLVADRSRTGSDKGSDGAEGRGESDRGSQGGRQTGEGGRDSGDSRPGGSGSSGPGSGGSGGDDHPLGVRPSGGRHEPGEDSDEDSGNGGHGDDRPSRGVSGGGPGPSGGPPREDDSSGHGPSGGSDESDDSD
ncbi:MAG TPA: sigma-70 family RNA polymerase sigma factor, partial [Solirubrobacterales bacterium]|nr:sigma-70 family RNA polymerase sigma factor [Solirubrobacterales bacterium]